MLFYSFVANDIAKGRTVTHVSMYKHIKRNWRKCIGGKRTDEYAFSFKCHFVADIYIFGATLLVARNRKVNFINANGDIQYAKKKGYC